MMAGKEHSCLELLYLAQVRGGRLPLDTVEEWMVRVRSPREVLGGGVRWRRGRGGNTDEGKAAGPPDLQS